MFVLRDFVEEPVVNSTSSSMRFFLISLLRKIMLSLHLLALISILVPRAYILF